MNNIQPELKRLHSPDLLNLDNPKLDRERPFCILVQAMFGPIGSPGEEAFDVLVCNPKWIEQRSREGMFTGRHHLIVEEFDANRIRLFLAALAEHCAAPTWAEVAEKLGRIGKWEFEDFVT